jgi:hypothetical protein
LAGARCPQCTSVDGPTPCGHHPRPSCYLCPLLWLCSSGSGIKQALLPVPPAQEVLAGKLFSSMHEGSSSLGKEGMCMREEVQVECSGSSVAWLQGRYVPSLAVLFLAGNEHGVSSEEARWLEQTEKRRNRSYVQAKCPRAIALQSTLFAHRGVH